MNRSGLIRSASSAARNSATFSSTNALGRHAERLGGLGDVDAVLVGAGQEPGLVARHPVPAGDDVRADDLVDRVQPGRVVRVGDRGREVEAVAVGHGRAMVASGVSGPRDRLDAAARIVAAAAAARPRGGGQRRPQEPAGGRARGLGEPRRGQPARPRPGPRSVGPGRLIASMSSATSSSIARTSSAVASASSVRRTASGALVAWSSTPESRVPTSSVTGPAASRSSRREGGGRVAQQDPAPLEHDGAPIRIRGTPSASRPRRGSGAGRRAARRGRSRAAARPPRGRAPSGGSCRCSASGRRPGRPAGCRRSR